MILTRAAFGNQRAQAFFGSGGVTIGEADGAFFQLRVLRHLGGDFHVEVAHDAEGVGVAVFSCGVRNVLVRSVGMGGRLFRFGGGGVHQGVVLIFH